jgi:predicted RNA-binding Zn-ribbon protein involved in translation (DUF1610 family)
MGECPKCGGVIYRESEWHLTTKVYYVKCISCGKRIYDKNPDGDTSAYIKPRRKIGPHFVKGRRDYYCLLCKEKIPEGTLYVYMSTTIREDGEKRNFIRRWHTECFRRR